MEDKKRKINTNLVNRPAKFQNNTFSATDITPYVIYTNPDGTGSEIVKIGDISTITYSIHQDKNAIRTLGYAAPRGYTHGPETIAGTIIFNIFDRQALDDIHRPTSTKQRRSRPMSSLPPFDIILYFENEYGSVSKLGIFGVNILDEGQTHSIEDTFIENQANYVALYIQPLGDNYTKSYIPQRMDKNGNLIPLASSLQNELYGINNLPSAGRFNATASTTGTTPDIDR